MILGQLVTVRRRPPSHPQVQPLREWLWRCTSWPPAMVSTVQGGSDTCRWYLPPKASVDPCHTPLSRDELVCRYGTGRVVGLMDANVECYRTSSTKHTEGVTPRFASSCSSIMLQRFLGGFGCRACAPALRCLASPLGPQSIPCSSSTHTITTESAGSGGSSLKEHSGSEVASQIIWFCVQGGGAKLILHSFSEQYEAIGPSGCGIHAIFVLFAPSHKDAPYFVIWRQFRNSQFRFEFRKWQIRSHWPKEGTLVLHAMNKGKTRRGANGGSAPLPREVQYARGFQENGGGGRGYQTVTRQGE